MLRTTRFLRPLLRRGLETESAQVIDCAESTSEVTSKILKETADKSNRLFAVVYVNERQFKITQNDLITLESTSPLQVGDKIKLDKVLAIGGSSFTVFGRPLLPSSSTNVTATVVEKTAKYPEAHYVHENHQRAHFLNWLSKEVTILRVNSVEAKPELLQNS
ncbi:unnamed protein product, partial [Mesorhabditis spiculigera]